MSLQNTSLFSGLQCLPSLQVISQTSNSHKESLHYSKLV